MSTAAMGKDAQLYIGGTLIGLLTGIEFSWERGYSEFCPMGSLEPMQVLLGQRRYRGSFRKAYVDTTYANIFTSGVTAVGSLVPRSGHSVVGTLVIVGGSFGNMSKEESAEIFEEGTFVMYSVTFA